jgi:hypothetical protein
MPDVKIEDFVAPEKAPHEFRPIIEQLIAAGPDKVATVIVDTEDEAFTFVRAMQSAAREVGHSARKRVLVAEGKKIKVGVSVGDKIVRNRAPKTAE